MATDGGTTERPGGLTGFRPDARLARRLDDEDPLASFRSRFHRPRQPDGRPTVYFAGNSLGLQPEGALEAVQNEMQLWREHAVGGHFQGDAPWFSYHELLREPFARLVGARSDEVVAMNSLTVNLHLMMVSFYRPTERRYKILMEDTAFPSDTYAVRTQLRHHGHDPDDALIVVRSSRGGPTIPTDEMEGVIEACGDEVALVLLGGVNYYTGQLFDMKRIAACARRKGCLVGLDLAHAAGNVPLQLHDWKVDFAVWCTYKYLNAGPGAVAGCFVHERHARRSEVPRFGGWWGNDPVHRFRMHLEPEFRAQPSADGWQLSNPPILALAPLRVSLRLFDDAGLPALRAKSKKLTAYMQSWVDHAADGRIETLTPRPADERGCQLSLRALGRPRELFVALREAGIVGDFREPDVVRVAAVPLYNSFHDVWSFGRALEAWAGITG
jgi:kynureninase